ncbi:hypothetical protein AHAS_Ahas06G0144300 [Arachis hypogaea]
MQGLSSNTIKEFNFLPSLFINNFQKLRYVSLPSSKPVRLVFGKSFGRKSKKRIKNEYSENILSGENITLDEQTLEEELQNAITKDNYAKAAKIRDMLKQLQKDSLTIFGINNQFYE